MQVLGGKDRNLQVCRFDGEPNQSFKWGPSFPGLGIFSAFGGHKKMALKSCVFCFRLMSKIIPFLFCQEKQDVEAETAALMKRHLPPTLLGMVDAGTWPGDGLLVMENPLSRPSASEIAQNYVFLRPLVILSPRRAPLIYSMLDLLFNTGYVACVSSRF